MTQSINYYVCAERQLSSFSIYSTEENQINGSSEVKVKAERLSHYMGKRGQGRRLVNPTISWWPLSNVDMFRAQVLRLVLQLICSHSSGICSHIASASNLVVSVAYLLLLFGSQVVSNSLQPHRLQLAKLLCPALSLEFAKFDAH